MMDVPIRVPPACIAGGTFIIRGGIRQCPMRKEVFATRYSPCRMMKVQQDASHGMTGCGLIWWHGIIEFPRADRQHLSGCFREAYGHLSSFLIPVGRTGTIVHRDHQRFSRRGCGRSSPQDGAASNIPYGLVLALLLVGLSAWAARSRSGVLGAGFHLLSSSAMAWLMAFPGPGGDVLVPVGGKGVFLSFFGLHAGYIWLFGVIVVQLVMLVFPQRWYQVHTVKRQADDTAADALVSDSVAADSAASDSAVLDNQASGDPRTQS